MNGMYRKTLTASFLFPASSFHEANSNLTFDLVTVLSEFLSVGLTLLLSCTVYMLQAIIENITIFSLFFFDVFA